MKRLIKLLTVIVMMTLVTPVVAFAQNASESYDNGIALMKKGDYSGAIKSFQRSMTINKSADNKKKCNKQIDICKRRMREKEVDGDRRVVEANEKKLSLSKDRVPFPWNPMEDLTIEIITEPFSNDWMASVENNESWLELSKSMDGRSLILKCKPTEITVKREAKVCVTYGAQRKNVQVVQYGKEVKFSATPMETTFKLKGGKQLVNISCNSDTVYENGRNWKIKQAPDWIKTEATETTLILEAPGAKERREGQIIIVSQNQEFMLKVEQKKKM